LILGYFDLLSNVTIPGHAPKSGIVTLKRSTTMSGQNRKNHYSIKDTLQVLFGIPVVMTVAVFCANFATSYAGI
jgi:hypothetical protein